MGRLAVYKFAYFLSILFTIFILGCQYDIIYLLAHQTTVLVMDSIDGSDSKLRIHHFHVPNL